MHRTVEKTSAESMWLAAASYSTRSDPILYIFLVLPSLSARALHFCTFYNLKLQEPREESQRV